MLLMEVARKVIPRVAERTRRMLNAHTQTYAERKLMKRVAYNVLRLNSLLNQINRFYEVNESLNHNTWCVFVLILDYFWNFS